MKETRILMGMPITIEIVAPRDASTLSTLESTFEYFRTVEETFSAYKDTSEVMRLNRGELTLETASPDVREIFALAEETKRDTDGYFDVINRKGLKDPSGIVKGWAIRNAAARIHEAGFNHYYVNAGGDIQARGLNAKGDRWSVGIRNPFKTSEIVKVIFPGEHGVATSGTYERGQHIYNPKNKAQTFTDILSLTVIGPDVYEADRFATAAFAMGRAGLTFLAGLPGFEAYMIDSTGTATMTEGFASFT